jgi:hypothetical protein
VHQLEQLPNDRLIVWRYLVRAKSSVQCVLISSFGFCFLDSIPRRLECAVPQPHPGTIDPVLQFGRSIRNEHAAEKIALVKSQRFFVPGVGKRAVEVRLVRL